MEPHDILKVLRRRRVLGIGCFLIIVGATLVFTRVQEKQYEATASLLFRDPGLDQKLFGSTYLAPSRDPAREAATNVRLVSLDVVAERTASLLGRGLDQATVDAKTSVKAEGQSDVVSIAARDPNPNRAAQIANTFAAEYVRFRREADRAKIREAEQLVENQIGSIGPSERATPRARSLEGRAEELKILGSLQTGNAELVQRAAPPNSPASPRPVRSGVLAMLFGGLIGVAAAFLAERLDRRLREPEEASETFGLPLLGVIPENKDLRSAASIRDRGLSGSETEAFRLLRARLRYFNIDQDIRSVLITSAGPGDGKSTVCLNLAQTTARADTSTVLVEADLRRPTSASVLGVDSMPGLAEHLSHHASLDDVIRRVPVDSLGGGGPEGVVLDIIPAGSVPPNPAELLESKGMAQLLEELARRYELVIVDTPPTSVVSDAIPLMTQVDGVLIVTRMHKSTRESSRQLSEQLRNLNAPVLGVVANGVRSEDNVDYGYYSADRYRAIESPVRS